MRELTNEEMGTASGGITPLIGFAIALGGKATGSAGVLGWAVGSIGLVAASWDLADYFLQKSH